MVGLERTVAEAFAGHHPFLPQQVGGHSQFAAVGVDHRHHLPELQRHLHALVERIVVAEHRAGEHRDAEALAPGVLQHVVLQRQPAALVELRHLGHRVGVDEGVVLSLPGDGIAVAPAGILATHHVALVERSRAVEVLVSDLRGRLDARVEAPGILALERTLERAVDIHRGEDRQAPAGAHHHREMQIVQARALAHRQHLVALARLGQGRLRPEEGLVETLALGQVGDAALLFLEARHAALQLRPGHRHPGATRQQAADHAGLHRIVGLAELAAEVQADHLAAVDRKHRRAGIAAQGRAVVGQVPGVMGQSHDFAGSEALDVVDVAEDIFHRPGVVAAVARRIADHRHRLARLGILAREDQRRRQQVALHYLEDRHVRRLGDVRGDPQDPRDHMLVAFRLAVFLAEVHAGAHLLAGLVETEAEQAALAFGEQAGDMPVGDDQVVLDAPAGTAPVHAVVVDQFQPTDRADRRGQRGAMLLQALLQAGQRRFVEDTVLHQQHRPALEQDDRLAEAPRVEERGVGFRRHALAQVVGDLLAAGVVRRHVAPLTAGGEVGEFLAGALFLQYRADPQFFRRGPPGVALAHGHVPRWADIPGRSLAEGHDRAMSRWRTAAQLNRRTAGRPGCGFPPSTDSRWLATPPPARRAPRPAPAIRPAPDRRRRRGCGSGTG